jgi:hypothetical protein
MALRRILGGKITGTLPQPVTVQGESTATP